jgi:hypothetical protein
MRSENLRPSPFRVLQSDFIALGSILFPAVMWGMYIVIAYFGFFPGFRGHDPIQGSEGAPAFLYLGIITTLIGVPLFVWRWRSFQSVFARGRVVTGRIASVSFSRDRGRVEYSYEYSGQRYHGGNAIMKTKRTKALQEGDEVELIVDPENPKRALIRDLYV